MAIQNFLSGGYYGKLGATVGQRWKNKRTIRTYVIPANPRTEKQQANRGSFGNAVQFSQTGMQMNFYATCFEDPGMSKWNYRMSTARKLKDSGQEYLNLIPLYPVDFVPPTVLASITVLSKTAQGHCVFSVPDLEDESDRTLSMMFAYFNSTGALIGYKLYIGYYYAANPGVIEADIDDPEEIDDYTCVRIVSNDDEDSEQDMIASPQLAVQSGSPEIRDFNTTVLYVENTAQGTYIVFGEEYRTASVNTVNGTAQVIQYGIVKNITLDAAALVNRDGNFALFLANIPATSAGAYLFSNNIYLTITSLTVAGAAFRYTAENVTEEYNSFPYYAELTAQDFTAEQSANSVSIACTVKFERGEEIENAQYSPQGRLGITTPETILLQCTTNLQTGCKFAMSENWGMYPASNSPLVIPVTTLYAGGAEYRITSALTLNITYSAGVSRLFVDYAETKERQGATTSEPELSYLFFSGSIPAHAGTSVSDDDIDGQSYKVTKNDVTVDTAWGWGYSGSQNGSAYDIVLTVNFSGSEDCTPASEHTVERIVDTIQIDGVYYALPNIYERLSNFAEA